MAPTAHSVHIAEQVQTLLSNILISKALDVVTLSHSFAECEHQDIDQEHAEEKIDGCPEARFKFVLLRWCEGQPDSHPRAYAKCDNYTEGCEHTNGKEWNGSIAL